MFEWEANDLQAGDEFTIDHGETWIRVQKVVIDASEDLPVHVTKADGETLKLGYSRRVIVR